MGTFLGVGHKLPGFSGTMPEGAQFMPSWGDQPFLMFFYSNPTSHEIAAIERAKPWLGLFRVSPHTFYLLYGIPGFVQPDGWGDAPYSVMNTPESERTLPPRDPDRGWMLTTLIVDRDTGIIRYMRASTMSPDFSQALEDLMAEQRANGASFTRDTQVADVARINAKYPMPSAMLRDAVIVEPIGVPFAEAREKRMGTMFRGQAGA